MIIFISSLVLFSLQKCISHCQNSNWSVCVSKVNNYKTDESYSFCDICYVPKRELQVSTRPTFELYPSKTFAETDCSKCEQNFSQVLPYVLIPPIFEEDFEYFLKESSEKFAGILLLVDETKATYDYIIKVAGDSLDSSEPTAPWIFVRTKTPVARSTNGIELITFFRSREAQLDKATIVSFKIDIKNLSPPLFDVYSACGMLMLTLLIFITVFFIKTVDRKHTVYSLDQFVDCSKRNRRIEFAVYIARFNKLAAFFAILFIILYSLMVTIAPTFMKYFYYFGYGVSGATAFIFLIARVPMKLQRKVKTFKKKAYQVSFIVVTATCGTLATLMIILLKDETVFRFESQFVDTCLKLLPFWFVVNFMIVCALLLHITFRSYVELAIFEIGCIVIDQVFRTAHFTNKNHEHKQSQPFLDFYYMYGDSYFQINQGFIYTNATITIHNYEPHSTPMTNPYTFKWHWHYSDLPCQIPYTRFYPIWFVTIPGYALLHSIHYNAEQSQRRSKVFPVLAFVVAMVSSAAEEAIRLCFNFPLGIGVISFTLLSLLSLLWFCKLKEIGDYVEGVYAYVSRSHVSSGI